MQNVAQLGATVFSLLVLGQVFQSFAFRNLETALSGQGFSDAQIHSLVAGTQSKLFKELSPELVERATWAITEAIRKVYYLSIVAGALSILSALLMKKERLFAKEAAGQN